MSDDNDKNLELWDKHATTPPEHLKEVDYGRKYTSIKSPFQIREATGEWGPCGAGWGLRDLEFSEIGEVTYTVPEKPASGNKKAKPARTYTVPAEIKAQAVFWYAYPKVGASTMGEIPMAASLAFEPGDEIYLKLTTRLISKALSRLGFNADVYMDQAGGKAATGSKSPQAGQRDGNRQQGGQANGPSAKQQALIDRLLGELEMKEGDFLGLVADMFDQAVDKATGNISTAKLTRGQVSDIITKLNGFKR